VLRCRYIPFFSDESFDQSRQLLLAHSDAPNWKEGAEGHNLLAPCHSIVDYFETPNLGQKAGERTKTLIARWDQ
jgi:hypothetical protein